MPNALAACSTFPPAIFSASARACFSISWMVAGATGGCTTGEPKTGIFSGSVEWFRLFSSASESSKL